MMNLKSLLLLSFLLVPSLILAVPLQIPYSGQLSESGTLVNGTRAMTFVIYDAASGGSALYTQNEPAVTVTNGVYHTTLNAPDTVWNGSDRWLGVSVNGGTELTPRTKIGSVPYAIRSNEANHATTADGLVSPSPQPGINWASYNGSIPITSMASYLSVTINCPVAGFVLVRTSGYCAVDNNGGLAYGISTNPAIWNYGAFAGISSVAPAPSPPIFIQCPISVSGVFPVSAGLNTFHLVAATFAGSASIAFPVIIAEWFPNRYQ